MSIIRIIFYWLVAIAFLQNSGCHAFIFYITELSHPVLKQTIILAGDCHEITPQDDRQMEDSVQATKKYKGHTIIEAPIYEMLFGGSPGFLGKLSHLLHKNNCSTSAVEHREAFSLLLGILYTAQHPPTEQSPKEYLLQEKIKQLIYEGFRATNLENKWVITELATFVNKNKENYRSSPLLPLLNAIATTTENAQQLADKIAVMVPQPKPEQNEKEQKNSIALSLIEDFLSEQDPYKDQPILQSKRPLDVAFFMSHQLLDARILKEIIEHKQKRLICVYAGEAHIQSIKKILVSAGYRIENKQKTFSGKNPPPFLKKEEEETNPSSEISHYALDIEAFMKNCKTCSQGSWATFGTWWARR